MKIIIQPGGRIVEIPEGKSLQDILFEAGVEYPCGGEGACRGCRVQVLDGDAPPSPEDLRESTPGELAAGWRLACRLRPVPGLTVLVREWEASVLEDAAALAAGGREGLGIAIDLGTTTIVAQLVDLATGGILGVRSALNRQRRWGDDLMTRLSKAIQEGGRAPLVAAIREQLGEMAADLLRSGNPAGAVRDVVVVGNTAMRCFLLDEDPALLAFHPFEPAGTAAWEGEAEALGWASAGGARVWFPPLLGGLVGADVLAGVLAVDLHRQEAPVALADLGTNAEVVVAAGGSILAASAAAGPAFEGGRIGMGMIAQTGAIDSVEVRDGGLAVHVIGSVPPRGLCGSGLVDAIACGLATGAIAASGRLKAGQSWEIAAPVALSQSDVRELQLAKGAVRAGVDLLLRELGIGPGDLARFHLSGGFGNYVSARSAERIGLLPVDAGRLLSSGNTALRGARKILLEGDAGRAACEDVRRRTRHVRLAAIPGFQDAFADAMRFP